MLVSSLLSNIILCSGSSACEVSLDHAYKTFSKKPVLQLEAIPELDILVSLSDNAVAIHELGSLKLLTDATQSLNQTRGANVFAIHVQVRLLVVTGFSILM